MISRIVSIAVLALFLTAPVCAQQKQDDVQRREDAGKLYSSSVIVPPNCSTVYLPGTHTLRRSRQLSGSRRS
jgi:hypothetical protein